MNGGYDKIIRVFDINSKMTAKSRTFDAKINRLKYIKALESLIIGFGDGNEFTD